jgi:hypothetical protein
VGSLLSWPAAPAAAAGTSLQACAEARCRQTCSMGTVQASMQDDAKGLTGAAAYGCCCCMLAARRTLSCCAHAQSAQSRDTQACRMRSSPMHVKPPHNSLVACVDGRLRVAARRTQDAATRVRVCAVHACDAWVRATGGGARLCAPACCSAVSAAAADGKTWCGAVVCVSHASSGVALKCYLIKPMMQHNPESPVARQPLPRTCSQAHINSG